jgi:menaquinone-dependent protoporphyrinogen oxidase
MRSKVLVAYATKHGSTRGIAERIGRRLESHALEVDVLDVDGVADVAAYDAFVLGSAVYIGSWRKEAVRFARKHAAAMAARPSWLFSSGPLAEPGVEQPKQMAELSAALKPRDNKVFPGALDGSTLSLPERLVISAVQAQTEHQMAGDFRDWDEIDAWADGIAKALDREPVEVD